MSALDVMHQLADCACAHGSAEHQPCAACTEAIIADALAAERERCALIAEEHGCLDGCDLNDSKGRPGLLHWEECPRTIAGEIRNPPGQLFNQDTYWAKRLREEVAP